MGTRSVALVLAGVLLGGALDHFILALAGSRRTPYGVSSGRYGNWLLGFIDLVLAGAILRFGRQPDVHGDRARLSAAGVVRRA